MFYTQYLSHHSVNRQSWGLAILWVYAVYLPPQIRDYSCNKTPMYETS